MVNMGPDGGLVMPHEVDQSPDADNPPVGEDVDEDDTDLPDLVDRAQDNNDQET